MAPWGTDVTVQRAAALPALPPQPHAIPAMSERAIATVRSAQELALQMEQVSIVTDHVIHGGMYARTVMIPAGTIIIGVLVKVPTILMVQGEVQVYLGDTTLDLKGYNVLPAGAGRKQAFRAFSDTWLTMILATPARDVEQAERAFTDEFDLLASHRDTETNHVRITGE